jgi:hypothetical protein
MGDFLLAKFGCLTNNMKKGGLELLCPTTLQYHFLQAEEDNVLLLDTCPLKAYYASTSRTD